jgi:hypothetical protein
MCRPSSRRRRRSTKKALKHFYDHVTATNAINENETGGFKLLVRQMADAIGKKFAVHEIVWKPGADGLTAEFRFAPLWFFENRTGRLRYLPIEGAIEGRISTRTTGSSRWATGS